MTPTHPRLKPLDSLANALGAAASSTARAATKKVRAVVRRRNYATRRPGPETPLWNELAEACRTQLTSFGDKARLARILGVSRQRLHLLLVTKTACPDAERVLQLMLWLSARRQGIKPG